MAIVLIIDLSYNAVNLINGTQEYVYERVFCC